jgi:hypothetical protein
MCTRRYGCHAWNCYQSVNICADFSAIPGIIYQAGIPLDYVLFLSVLDDRRFVFPGPFNCSRILEALLATQGLSQASKLRSIDHVADFMDSSYQRRVALTCFFDRRQV